MRVYLAKHRDNLLENLIDNIYTQLTNSPLYYMCFSCIMYAKPRNTKPIRQNRKMLDTRLRALVPFSSFSDPHCPTGMLCRSSPVSSRNEYAVLCNLAVLLLPHQATTKQGQQYIYATRTLGRPLSLFPVDARHSQQHLTLPVANLPRHALIYEWTIAAEILTSVVEVVQKPVVLFVLSWQGHCCAVNSCAYLLTRTSKTGRHSAGKRSKNHQPLCIRCRCRCPCVGQVSSNCWEFFQKSCRTPILMLRLTWSSRPSHVLLLTRCVSLLLAVVDSSLLCGTSCDGGNLRNES